MTAACGYTVCRLGEFRAEVIAAPLLQLCQNLHGLNRVFLGPEALAKEQHKELVRIVQQELQVQGVIVRMRGAAVLL